MEIPAPFDRPFADLPRSGSMTSGATPQPVENEAKLRAGGKSHTRGEKGGVAPDFLTDAFP